MSSESRDRLARWKYARPRSGRASSPRRHRTVRARGFAVVSFLLATAIVLVVASTVGASGNDQSVQKYLAARHAWGATVVALSRGAHARVAHEVRAVGRECGGVLTKAPHSQDLDELSDEIVLTLEHVANGTAADHADLQFVRAVSQIRWNSTGLRRAVHALEIEETTRARMTPPNLCRQLDAWAASDYRALSSQTVQFLSRIATRGRQMAEPDGRKAPQESRGEAVLKVLGQKIPRHDQALGRQVQRREAKVETKQDEAIGEGFARLSHVLGQNSFQ
jgi:hypothetical protein